MLCGALGMACGDDPQVCTANIVASVVGYVLDPDGSRVVPDRVLIEYLERGVFECSVNPLEDGPVGFACLGGVPGPASVTAYVGNERVSQAIWVRMEEDGCHPVTQELVLRLE